MIVALTIFASVSTEGFNMRKSFESESAADAISLLYSQNEKDEECGTEWRDWSVPKRVYQSSLLAGSNFKQKVRIGEWYVRNNFSMETVKNKNFSLSPERQESFSCINGFCKVIPGKLMCEQQFVKFSISDSIEPIKLPTRCVPVPVQNLA